MDKRISVGETTPPMESINFFCSGSVKPENHILFALSLTSNMKQEAKERMRRVNYYKKNENKYKKIMRKNKEYRQG